MDTGQSVAGRAIHLQLCAMARAVDERDWDALEAVIAENASGDFAEGWQVRSRAEFVAMFQRFLGGCGPTQHLLGNLEVTVDAESAESRCYVRDMHQGKGEAAHLFFSSPGVYLDRWRRTPDGWRLTHCTKKNLMAIGSVEALSVVAGPEPSYTQET